MNGHHQNGGDYADYFLRFRNENLLNDKSSIQECFRHFDQNKDSALDINEFEQMLKSLFSFYGNSYFISKAKIRSMFNFFDENKQEKLSLKEFEVFWNRIVKITLRPCTALVIVDVQNDFIDGTLSLSNCSSKHNAAEVVPVINHLIETVPFDVIVYTLDWHPEDHCSFIENVNLRKLTINSPAKQNIKTYDTVIFEDYPDIEQKLWPAHCVQNSHGSQLHPDLIVVDEKTDAMKRHVVYTKKGSKSDIDSYSAFFDNCKLNETSLNIDLKKLGVNELYVCGLAADVCVAATSRDALGLNYRVVYVEDAARGVDIKDIEEQKKRLISQGALMVDSKQVINMVTSKDRRPELAFSTFYSLMH